MVDRNFSDWESQIADALTQSRSYCYAIYSTDRELIFANKGFHSLIIGDPCQSLINPSYEKIISLESDSDQIFSGHLTVGDINTVNNSIIANIYRKDNQFMIVGGMDILLLANQNRILHQMNAEILNLQRELLQKAHQQEITMTQLNATNDELAKANQDKDRFLKILAHDLRNPMLSISGFSELLLSNFRNYNEEKMEKHLTILSNSAKRTCDLLEELLLWTRSQSGKINFDPVPVNLYKICNEVISYLIESAHSKGIDILSTVDQHTTLHADTNMLSTVLRNLISNAIKFTHQDGRITISSSTSDDFVTITVSDNGVGISREDIDNIWQISELHTTPGTNGEKGTGLGLVLCKEFISKHGGEIWVESEVGVGSEFKFTIPGFHP